MHEENEIKTKILTRAYEMFLQFGSTRVTMEELASSLCISKKTLYKFFSNKEHLLKELVHSHKCEVIQKIDEILDDSSLDFMEKLKRFLSYVGSQSRRFVGPMMQDLMRNNPAIWNDIHEFRKVRTTEKIAKLFAEGAEQGFIRNDVNKEIATVMYVSSIHALITPDSIAQISVPVDAIMGEIMKILFQGVLTDNGRYIYKQKTEELFHKEVI